MNNLEAAFIIGIVTILLYIGSNNRRRRSPEYQRQRQIELEEDIDKELKK